MRETPADQNLAQAATELLLSWEHPMLEVTKVRARSWREQYYLPVLSDRKGGRDQMTEYAPRASETAARIAIELSNARSLERAVLAVFAQGCDVPDEGVRFAYGHYPRTKLLPRINGARNPKKRSQRMLFPGVSSADRPAVTEVLAAWMLGESPNESLTELAISKIAPEVSQLRTVDPRLFRTLVTTICSGTVKLTVGLAVDRYKDLTEVQAMCRDIRTMVDYAQALGALVAEVGWPALDPHAAALIRTFPALTRLPITDDMIALVAPIWLGLIGDRRSERRRNFDQAVAACATQTPRVRAARALALGIEPKWRRYLGSDATQLLLLPDEEREAIAVATQRWLAEHPDVDRDLGLPELRELAAAQNKP